MKQLIPLGSITSDPIGTERYMVVDGDNTAAETIVVCPYNAAKEESDWREYKKLHPLGWKS
jgi:hypothetical protein